MTNSNDVLGAAMPLIGLGVGLAVLDYATSNLKKKKRKGKAMSGVNRVLFG